MYRRWPRAIGQRRPRITSGSLPHGIRYPRDAAQVGEHPQCADWQSEKLLVKSFGEGWVNAHIGGVRAEIV